MSRRVTTGSASKRRDLAIRARLCST
jgi:hypothetical protein